MSHYITKSITIDRKSEKVFLTAADSSLRPLQFFRTEYGKEGAPFNERLHSLFTDIMDGNLKLYASCRYRDVADTLRRKYEEITKGHDVLVNDLIYRTDFHAALQDYLATAYAIPAATGGSPQEDAPYEAGFLDACMSRWADEARRLDEEGVVLIKSACRIRWLPGYDALISLDGRFLIADAKGYDNRGRLDDSSHSAIIFGRGAADELWNKAAYADSMDCEGLDRLAVKWPEFRQIKDIFRMRQRTPAHAEADGLDMAGRSCRERQP